MDIRDFYMANAAKGQEAMRRKKAEGERMHLAPLGWRNARDELGRSVLEPDPKTYPLVREAIVMRAEGRTVREICRAMHELGLRSKRGNRVGPSAMHRALEHRTLA